MTSSPKGRSEVASPPSPCRRQTNPGWSSASSLIRASAPTNSVSCGLVERGQESRHVELREVKLPPSSPDPFRPLFCSYPEVSTLQAVRMPRRDLGRAKENDPCCPRSSFPMARRRWCSRTSRPANSSLASAKPCRGPNRSFASRRIGKPKRRPSPGPLRRKRSTISTAFPRRSIACAIPHLARRPWPGGWPS